MSVSELAHLYQKMGVPRAQEKAAPHKYVLLKYHGLTSTHLQSALSRDYQTRGLT
jgi:hypothetical protein